MAVITQPQPVIWDEIIIGRDNAMEIFEEQIFWNFGLIVSVAYKENESGKTYMLSAVGIGRGYGEYSLTLDSKIIEEQISSFYHTVWNMNGATGNVLNDHGDEELSDPFAIQNL